MAKIEFTQRDAMVNLACHQLQSLAQYDCLPDAELFEDWEWLNEKRNVLQRKCEAIGIDRRELYGEAVISADEYRG